MSRIGLVRLWLPLAVTLAGVVAMVAGLAGDEIAWLEGGAFVVSAGLSIWLLNFLYRVSVHGDRDRQTEDDARAFFDEHGHWPDDEPPPRGRS